MSFGIDTYQFTNNSDALFYACHTVKLLAPSSNQENFGVSLTEASSVETAVLCSNRVIILYKFNKLCAGFFENNDVMRINGLLSRWLALSSTNEQQSRDVKLLALWLSSQLYLFWMILADCFLSLLMEFEGV